MVNPYEAEIGLELAEILGLVVRIENEAKPRHETAWRQNIRLQLCGERAKRMRMHVQAIDEWLRRAARQQTAHTLKLEGRG